MTFPTTPILDNFNRANEGPPPSTNWVTLGPYGFKVVSNQAAPSNALESIAVWNTIFGRDLEWYISLPVMSTAIVEVLRVLFRCTTQSTAGSGFYFLDVFQTNGTDLGLLLVRRYTTTDEDYPGYGVIPGGFNSGVVKAVGMRVVASRFDVYWQDASNVWNLLYTAYDSSFIHAGYLILYANQSGTALRLDDFGGGAIPPITDDDGGQPGDDDPGGSAPGPVEVGPAYLINAHHIDASGAGAIGLRVADVAYVMNSRVTGDVGVQVETGGILRPYGLQYPSKNLVGTGAIKPLFGDRAAWDTTLYAGRHAHDISEGTYDYHTDPTNPPVTQLAPLVTVSTNTTLDATHYIVIVSNGSTITLPTAASIAGKQYNIIRSGTSNVLINTTGGQTISGDASLTLTAQWDSVVVVSNGSNWIRCS